MVFTCDIAGLQRATLRAHLFYCSDFRHISIWFLFIVILYKWKPFSKGAHYFALMDISSEECQLKCPTCGKFFKRKDYLTEHLRTHTGERPYVCSVCEKSFSQSGSRNTHMKIHSEETPYICPTCGTGFKRKGNLQSHLRGECIYKCGLCEKSFSQSRSRVKHMETCSAKKNWIKWKKCLMFAM